MKKLIAVTLVLAMVSSANAQWSYLWEVGDGADWNADGARDSQIFVQEAGATPAPGDPASPNTNQQADDDYYFAGEYPDPINTLSPGRPGALANGDELVLERAFANIDNDLRFHFNLPANLNPTDKLRITSKPINLEAPDSRYGFEFIFNDVVVMPEVIIRSADLGTAVVSAEFTVADINAALGPGGDNVVNIHGINYNDDGGGNWMGMDYHALEVSPVPEPGNNALMLSIVWALPILLYTRRRKNRA